FPRADALSNLLDTEPEKPAENDGYTIRNRFWSFNRKAWVVVFEKDGRVGHVLDHGTNTATRLIETLDCSFAWGIEQESKAVQTLGTLLRHHIFKSYLLTGMFLETSKRSGLTYVFRRLRPTIVLDAKGDHITVRCCLCMHPIGYYEGTWAGAMTPTDDVIAHLMMMRGDEPRIDRHSERRRRRYEADLRQEQPGRVHPGGAHREGHDPPWIRAADRGRRSEGRERLPAGEGISGRHLRIHHRGF
ncbi:hypothetical protein DBT53_004480, partial [Aerococcus mictus]|uniref:hypothetical protein n=1 Tax=Aerococcus mictus TaxID=2976810 RepID=UPI002FD60CA5